VLLEKLANKLRYDRIGYGIMFNNLKLGVDNGVVTIAGDVRDYAARDSALTIVATEPGVKDVIDEINVLPTSTFRTRNLHPPCLAKVRNRPPGTHPYCS
jgi:hyperosmotically inducible protein